MKKVNKNLKSSYATVVRLFEEVNMYGSLECSAFQGPLSSTVARHELRDLKSWSGRVDIQTPWPRLQRWPLSYWLVDVS